ncbi:PREDICTED: probable serine/threonine-protein kinase DDB_G0282963 [Eufriesea mexicana]|uniref:probable serine/threonine-protein kinase DDB_G0282963 n=1 Tax=Eufriesea mexicana TaxID=516756 RepID=UPI00083BB0FD|nr:PREDICTED: probable serine/threonine-protein kinase DDB_G0282963 [Eufriesea mexicana]
MDIVPTQVYQDFDFTSTQEISQSAPQNDIQIGMLIIGSNTYPVKQGINYIGRHPDSDIVINDLTVSKKHAEIEINGYETTAWVCDLNSSNKTKLNNSILRPNRCYELKNGNVLEFGLVRAVYKTCRSADESLIVGPTIQNRKVQQLIIPGTPDSSLNNSSSLGENISVIPATQADEKESVFRCPTLPLRTSTSSARKSSIISSSIDISVDDLQSFDAEKKENVGPARIGINEMETQKLFESNNETNSDIHDVETQKMGLDKIEDLSKSSNKQEINIHDVVKQCITNAQGNITDIHDVETQPSTGIHDMITCKEINVQNISTRNNSTRDNKTFETEINEKENNNVNNKVMQEIDANESTSDSNDATKRKSRSEYVQNIEKNLQKDSQECPQLLFTTNYENEFDTSRNLLGSQNLLEDYINNDELSDDDKSKSLASVKVSSNDDVNSKSDNESIFDAATQINKIDESAFNNGNQRVKYTFKSPVVTDDSDETDNECIFQRYLYKNDKENEQFAKGQVVDSDDSTTDEEGQFMLIAMKEKANCSFEKEFNKNKEAKNNTGSSEDSENLFDTLTQPINHKNKDSLSRQDNENEVDSDAPTQVISKEVTKDYIENKDKHAKETDDMAPTQVLLTTESPSKGTRPPTTSITNEIISDKEDITEIEDNIPTQIINITMRKEVSSMNNDEYLNPLNPLAISTVNDCSIDNSDYEMAPTQPISDIKNQKSILSTTNKSTNVSIKSKALNTVNLDDTIERNLNAIFEDVNEERIEEHMQMSTQVLENVLQSPQYEDKLPDKNENSDTSTDNKTKSIKGRKSKTLKIDSNVTNKISRKSDIKNNNDSQNTENFATISTEKRNVLIDSRDPAEPTVNTSNENIEKEKTTLGTCSNMNNNSSSVSVTLSKCIFDDPSTPKPAPKNSSTPKSISKTLSTSKSVPADSSTPKSIPILDENLSIPKSVSKDPSTPKLKRKKYDRPKTGEVQEEIKIFEKDKNELDECSRDIDSQASNTLINEQLQRLTKVPENDDEDILAGLPEVRISGTLSNPASPTSSISSEYRININHNRRKQISVRIAPKKREASRKSSRKSLARKNVENTECPTAIKPNSLENNFDVDKESVHDNSKKDKKPKRLVKKVTTKNERKKSDTLPQSKSIAPINLQEKIRQSPLILNYRKTRNSSKENIDRSSVFQVRKEALIENEVAESAKGIDLNISRIGKRSLSVTDATENYPKKRKEDINEDATVDTNDRKKNTVANRRHSANTLNFIMKGNSSINTYGSSIKKSTDQEANLDKQAIIKVVRMSVGTPTGSISSSTSTELMIENNNSNKIRQSQSKTSIDSQVVTNISNNENKKTTKTVGTRGNANRKRINKFESHVDDISSQIGEESQEIEMIMNGMLTEENIDSNREKKKKVSKNTKSKNTKTKNTRGRRNTNTNTYTDVDNTESSSTSSTFYESDNARFEIPIIKLKQVKISKNGSNKTNAPVNESIKETKRNIKQSSRLIQSHQQSVTESSVEEETETDNQTVSGNTTNKTNNSRNKRQRQKTENVESNKKQKRDLVKKTISDSNSSIETASILSTPNRTRRSMTSSFTSSPFKIKHKILFTGISNNNYNKLLTKLGASQVEDPTKCTVLVTDKVRRTVKFLCALSLSVPIVSVDWLVDSERSGHFVELEDYILKDPAAEAKFRFKLAKSLEKAKKHKLLEGYTLVLTPNVAPPPLPELKSIIMSCGGKALLRPPSSWPQKAIIISREEDLGNANKFCARAPKTVTIQSTEFILTGILRQELEFKEFKLT